jgi:plastocyanin
LVRVSHENPPELRDRTGFSGGIRLAPARLVQQDSGPHRPLKGTLMNFRPSLAVGGALALASTFVVLTTLSVVGCGGSGSSPAAPSPTSTPTSTAGAADVTISITSSNGALSFSPSPATIKVGQTVAWRNADALPHTATADAAGGFNTGTLGPGATSAPITMATAGTFPYHCAIHTSMTATLVVTP